VTAAEGAGPIFPARRPLVRFVPERRLALALAATAPLWLLPGTVGVVVAGGVLAAILVAAAIDLVLLPSRRGLTLAREAPSALGIGDGAAGAYTVASHWPRPFEGELFDELPAAAPGGVGRAPLRLAPAGTSRLPFELRGQVRGRWPLGRVAVRVRSALGLVAARYAFVPADEILVVPSMTGVRRFRLLAIQHRLKAAGVRALRKRGEGQGFAGLRDYALGDDPRHIDWKATGRRRKLITREFTIERSQTILTLIDAGRGMTQITDGYPRFEHALSSALVLTDIAAGAGDRVGTLVFDDEVRAFVPAQRSAGALQAVRNALAPVVATTREPDYASAFRFLAARQRKRALIVFFTDVIDARASRSLLAHAAHSAARHLVVVVALRNDDIFAAATPRPRGDASVLYERAAAEELILARDEALEGMRRAGVVVLDVSPRMMTAAVINRYLELKARGAL
jgi:uncharacterized protein (DUF58 family)